MCADHFFDWGYLVIALLAAVGTVGAVIVSLLIAYGRIRRPRVSIQKIPRYKDYENIDIDGKDFSNVRFITFQIVNETKYTAHKVLVKLLGIESTVKDDYDLKLRKFDPFRLRLTSGTPDVDIYPLDSSNGFTLVCVKGKDTNLENELLFWSSKDDDPKQRGVSRTYYRTNYIVTVGVYGENIDPVINKIEILSKGRLSQAVEARML